MNDKFTALSLGWGVQSFSLAAMVALGELPPIDVAIHADTTHERSQTYKFAERWTLWLEERGVRIITVIDKIATSQIYRGYGQTHPPFYTNNKYGDPGQAHRSCTSRWKIQPIRRWLQANRNGQPVELWLGISLDEYHRMKDSDVKYFTNR